LFSAAAGAAAGIVGKAGGASAFAAARRATDRRWQPGPIGCWRRPSRLTMN